MSSILRPVDDLSDTLGIQRMSRATILRILNILLLYFIILNILYIFIIIKYIYSIRILHNFNYCLLQKYYFDL